MSEANRVDHRDEAEKTIAALERQLYDAMIGEDHAVLDELIAEGASYVHSNGVAETKQEYLNGVREGLYEYDSVESSNVEIRTFGNAAVATGTVLMSVGERGRPKSEVPLLSTLVWIVEGGRWRLLRRHATRLPAPRG